MERKQLIFIDGYIVNRYYQLYVGQNMLIELGDVDHRQGVSQLGEPSSITAALDRFFCCAQLEYFPFKLCSSDNTINGVLQYCNKC